jgi:hypothetical protein
VPRFAITFKPHYSYLLHDRVPLSPTTLPGNIDKLPWLLVGSPLFVRLLDLYVCTGVKADREGGTAAAAPMLPRSFFAMGYRLRHYGCSCPPFSNHLAWGDYRAI